MKDLIEDNQSACFFIDEIPAMRFKEIDNITKPQIVWVAMEYSPKTQSEIDNQFYYPELRHPLRTSANIMKFAQLMNSWTPDDINPDNYVLRGPKIQAVVLGKKGLLACLDEIIKIVNSLNLPTYLTCCNKEVEMNPEKSHGSFGGPKSNFFEARNILFESNLQPQIIQESEENSSSKFISKVKEFNASKSTNKAPIFLLNDSSEFNYMEGLRGTEIPVAVVLDIHHGFKNYLSMITTRCTSNLIVMVDEETISEKKLEDLDFIEVIRTKENAIKPTTPILK